MIDYEKISQLTGFDTLDAFQTAHKIWIDDFLEIDTFAKKQRWTESIAVGSKKFVTDILSQLGSRVNGRQIIEKEQTSQIREGIQPYDPLFEDENCNIAPKNTTDSSS